MSQNKEGDDKMAIKQDQLDNLTADVNTENSSLADEVLAKWNDIITWYNNNWCSAKAKECVDEVKTAVMGVWGNYVDSIKKQSDGVRAAISNESGTEGEEFTFNGFTVPTIDLSTAINEKLPDGGKGKAEGADINDLDKKVEELKSLIESHSKGVTAVTEGNSALDSSIMSALVSSVAGIGTSFVNLFTKLAESAATRFANEQSHRVEMADVNKSNVTVDGGK